MAREFDMLQSVNRRQFYPQPQDPSVDTFRQRFAPFSNSLEDVLDEIMKSGNDRYIVPGTPRFMDPSKIITDQRLPPAIGAPMASSGSPPSGAFLRAAQPQLAQALPSAATAVPSGLPDPTGRSPAAQQLGMPGGALGSSTPAAPAAPPSSGELVLPPGFRWAEPTVMERINQGANTVSETASSLYNRAKEALTPAPPGQSEQVNRALKSDSLRPFANSIQEVSAQLGRSPLDALPTEAVSKGFESPGNAAALARWSRAYGRASTDGSLYSLSALAVATKSLNSNLGTEIEPKALIASIRSERSPTTPQVTASGDAAASGGSEAAAAREVAAARLAQGARGTARALPPGQDRPGKTGEIAQGVLDMLEGPMRAITSSPYTAGMTPADYTDRPGADYPQQQLSNMAVPAAISRMAPGQGPYQSGTTFPRAISPAPSVPLALPPPRSVLPPGEMPPAVAPLSPIGRPQPQGYRAANENVGPEGPSMIDPMRREGYGSGQFSDFQGEGFVTNLINQLAKEKGKAPLSLADLVPAGSRRSIGHLKRSIQQRLDAGWTLTNDGRWVPPGGQ